MVRILFCLQAISVQLGVALTNAILYRQQQDARRYLQAVLGCCADYVFSVTVDGMLMQANKPLHRLFPNVDDAVIREKPCSEWMTRGAPGEIHYLFIISHYLVIITHYHSLVFTPHADSIFCCEPPPSMSATAASSDAATARA